jgi:hypothetical protein
MSNKADYSADGGKLLSIKYHLKAHYVRWRALTTK